MIPVSFSNQYRANEILDTVANVKKANDILHWHPEITLSEGLKRMRKDFQ